MGEKSPVPPLPLFNPWISVIAKPFPKAQPLRKINLLFASLNRRHQQREMICRRFLCLCLSFANSKANKDGELWRNESNNRFVFPNGRYHRQAKHYSPLRNESVRQRVIGGFADEVPYKNNNFYKNLQKKPIEIVKKRCYNVIAKQI